jgi:hypothetical protein
MDDPHHEMAKTYRPGQPCRASIRTEVAEARHLTPDISLRSRRAIEVKYPADATHEFVQAFPISPRL